MSPAPNFRAVAPSVLPTSEQLLDQSTVRSKALVEGRSLPLLVEPTTSNVEIGSWAKLNKTAIDNWLSAHGAVVFRGFAVGRDFGFQEFADAVGRGNLEYMQRSTRRTKVAAGVYTSTEYPAELPIALHSENSFQDSWPRRIMFHSVVVAETQGATPVADNVYVFDLIDPVVRDEFIARGIRYVRNFGGGFEIGWQEAFQTDDRSAVEAYLAEHAMVWEWKDGDRLRAEQNLPAVLFLPSLERLVWFNQAHLFHVTNLAADVRTALLKSLSLEDLPRHAFFGDGGEIPESYMANIRSAYESCSVRFDWNADDIMLIDNLRVCHGREPFTGARKVLVAMTEAASFDEFPVGESAVDLREHGRES